MMSSQGSKSVSQVRVIVVGAGLAGLSAAQHLLRHGFTKVTVLEASHRAGGRIQTCSFGHRACDFVELGANWIHGAAANNSFFVLANQLGMLEPYILLDRMEGYCYTPDGRAIDPHIANRLWELFQQWEAGTDCPSSETVNPSYSHEHYLRDRFQKSLNEFKPADHPDARCVFNCLLNYTRFHEGGYIETMPPPQFDEYLEIPGGTVKVAHGMGHIVSLLVASLPEGTIQYGQEVSSINWLQPEVKVTCKDGTTIAADHVICTTPLGYLKDNHDTLFTPLLPEAKTTAITGIRYGKVNKIFLQWERPFWKAGAGGIKLAWTDDETEIDGPKEWYKKIFAFDEVLNNHNVLIGWISGDEAEYVESLADEDIMRDCIYVIRRFTRNPSIPSPRKVLCTKWCSDPYFRGAYSFNSFTTGKDAMKQLAAPLSTKGPVPRVLFAGEATVPWAYSTLHGARYSGIREAENILNSHSQTAKI